MTNLYIMCGLAFSGKSTLSRKIAEQTGAKRIAFDEMWIAKNGGAWRFIRKEALNEVAKALSQGKTVIYDDTNPRFEHREELRKIGKRLGAKNIVIYLNTPMETIRERESVNRNTKERHEVESKNFKKVASDFEVPTNEEGFLEFTPESNLNEFLNNL